LGDLYGLSYVYVDLAGVSSESINIFSEEGENYKVGSLNLSSSEFDLDLVV